MKFMVKDPHAGQMEVEVPQTVLSRPPAAGEWFEVKTPQGTKRAVFLGDGESLLVGNTVVRMPRGFHVGKKNAYRFRFGASGAPRSLTISAIRPVEPKRTAASMGGGPLKSPMTGKVLAVNASEGQKVKEGDVLVIIEAMKMENRILCEGDGTVRSVVAKPGQAVTTGEVLLVVDPAGAPAAS